MRKLGFMVVTLGLAALGCVVIDAVRAHDQATDREHTAALQRLAIWAAIVGLAALATFASGVGSLLKSLRRVTTTETTPAASGDANCATDAEHGHQGGIAD